MPINSLDQRTSSAICKSPKSMATGKRGGSDFGQRAKFRLKMIGPCTLKISFQTKFRHANVLNAVHQQVRNVRKILIVEPFAYWCCNIKELLPVFGELRICRVDDIGKRPNVSDVFRSGYFFFRSLIL